MKRYILKALDAGAAFVFIVIGLAVFDPSPGSVADITMWLLAVLGLWICFYTVASIAIAIGEAVLFAREYYRENPEAEAPTDRLFVRLGLWGVR